MEETSRRRSARLSDAWGTRPARPRDGRVIAGVCAALGRRYGVDPVLVRVAFAVSAFYGPGIPLYLLGCIVLPDGGSSGTGRSRAVLSSVVLAGAAVVMAFLLFGGDGGWIAPLVVSLGLLALLHMARGDEVAAADPTAAPPVAGAAGPTAGHPAAPADHPTAPVPGTGAPDADATTDATAPVTGHDTTPATGPTDHTAADTTGTADPSPSPPAWDPLGVAPFAWDLPEPSSEEPPQPAGRSRITPLTLGLALLAAGAAGVVTLLAPGAVTPTVVPAAALAVVGAGLVVGAFRHAGRWLLPFALVLAIATWAVGAVPWGDLRGGVGSIVDAPVAAAGVAPEYRRGVGDVRLDLSGLDLRTPPGAPQASVRTAAHVGIGSIEVTVPRDADVVVRGSSDLGDVEVDGRTRGGSAVELTVVDDGPDGPGGGRVELDASAVLGSVRVNRG